MPFSTSSNCGRSLEEGMGGMTVLFDDVKDCAMRISLIREIFFVGRFVTRSIWTFHGPRFPNLIFSFASPIPVISKVVFLR